MTVESTATHRVHGGTLAYCRHESAATGTIMKFSIFMPPGKGPFPLLIWLSGLTCTEDNFTTKAGAYERLLLDVFRDDRTLFVRRDEVEQAWAYVDCVSSAWDVANMNPAPYPAGAWGPRAAADALIGPCGRIWGA